MVREDIYKNVFLIRNVSRFNYGGGETYQLKLAKKLAEYGYTPIIITNSEKLIKVAKQKGFGVLIPPFSRRQNWSGWRNALLPLYFIFQKKLTNWYRTEIRKYRPVAINIQSRDDMLAGTMAAKELGLKVLWTDHADFKNWVLWNVNVKYKNTIGKKIIKLSKDVEKVIFVSEEIKEETARMIAPQKLYNSVVIENGVDDELEKNIDVKTKKTSFVFVGRVVKEKGVEELIKAFTMVLAKYPDAKLNIYGDGEIKRFQKLSNNNVRFYGKTNNASRVLAENEVFILPSHHEGLSLSLLEAAMMGKKIIASDVDGNPEVVVDGKTGLLVPAKNVQKLAEAMIWMLEHKKEAEVMSRNARKRYEKYFNFEKIFEEKMLPLYNGEKEKK
ncbi:MAG: glycosyltransferase family 4 protein [Candidatus Saccharibacteria bacterium]|nr:glycosyltransferase family 4 protein [Candidatus Saccharibacteria bacterium]